LSASDDVVPPIIIAGFYGSGLFNSLRDSNSYASKVETGKMEDWNGGRLEKWNTGIRDWNRSKDYAICFLIHYSIVPTFHYSNTPFPLSCSRKSANLRWLAIDQRAMAAFDVALDLASSVWLDPSDISG
jgi:hypothetical protein